MLAISIRSNCKSVIRNLILYLWMSYGQTTITSKQKEGVLIYIHTENAQLFKLCLLKLGNPIINLKGLNDIPAGVKMPLRLLISWTTPTTLKTSNVQKLNQLQSCLMLSLHWLNIPPFNFPRIGFLTTVYIINKYLLFSWLTKCHLKALPVPTPIQKLLP